MQIRFKFVLYYIPSYTMFRSKIKYYAANIPIIYHKFQDLGRIVCSALYNKTILQVSFFFVVP